MTTTGLRVRDLYVYPLKSAAGIRVEAALLDAFGIAGDRRWMLVDARGRFLSQREQPRMALLRVSVPGASDMATPAGAAAGLVIEAPGMPMLQVATPGARAAGGGTANAETGAARVPVTVWDDACEALDAGDEAARWATAFLGEPCRLVYAPDDMVRRVDPAYARGGERVGFSDGFPLLLIGQGSLDDVNARLVAKGAAPVPMNRFRPNIVIEGAVPFAEDGWRRLAVGAAADPPSAAVVSSGAANVIHLDIVKPCARCSIIPVDQATGVRGKEPLATLATYRRRDGQVFFGQNVLHRGLGLLRAGDPVTLVS